MSTIIKRRKRLISFKSTRAYKRAGYVIPERLQIETSFKPKCKGGRGTPELAPLSLFGELNSGNNNHGSLTIGAMQREIIKNCGGCGLDALSYKEKEEDKENESPFILKKKTYHVHPSRLYNINNDKLDIKATTIFRVVKTSENYTKDTEYEFKVDLSPSADTHKTLAIIAACEEAIYRLDLLDVTERVNDLVAYESAIDLPFITIGKRWYQCSPVDERLGTVASRVEMEEFTVPYPHKVFGIDDVLNIPGYKGHRYPHYCCPDSLLALYKKKAVRGYQPETSHVSPGTQRRLLKSGKYGIANVNQTSISSNYKYNQPPIFPNYKRNRVDFRVKLGLMTAGKVPPRCINASARADRVYFDV